MAKRPRSDVSFGLTFLYTQQVFPLLKYEFDAISKGYNLIAGVDEVGRGPLAGPMVVAAVILNLNELNKLSVEDITNNDVLYYKRINDSKKLTQKSREDLEVFIKSKALSYKIIEMSNREIDTIGISEVTQKAFYDAISGLHIKPEYIITDNFQIKKIVPHLQLNLPKGDAQSMTVAAASIIAKVYRDALMCVEHDKYPSYGFAKHKGYGTVEHMAAIKKYGPCPIHRISFEPLKSLYS